MRLALRENNHEFLDLAKQQGRRVFQHLSRDDVGTYTRHVSHNEVNLLLICRTISFKRMMKLVSS